MGLLVPKGGLDLGRLCNFFYVKRFRASDWLLIVYDCSLSVA
jgi:hypothetical protein